MEMSDVPYHLLLAALILRNGKDTVEISKAEIEKVNGTKCTWNSDGNVWTVTVQRSITS
jgi:hypothetical protein